MKGVYVLLVSVCRQIIVDIGKLGAVTFRKGFYAYVGSDQNNLEKRIARHLRRNKRIFWHIDYLLDSKYAKSCRRVLEGNRKSRGVRNSKEDE